MVCVYHHNIWHASGFHNMNEKIDHRGSRAQVMLEEALRRAQAAGRSQRTVAAELGYKSSVVLSHMGLGRVPIPVDRARDIAMQLDMDSDAFLMAVLEQRYPGADFRALFNMSYSSNRTVAKLEAVAGCSLDELPVETKSMLEEVIAARHPRRRWLSTAELATINLVRSLRPDSPFSDLSEDDRQAIEKALTRS